MYWKYYMSKKIKNLGDMGNILSISIPLSLFLLFQGIISSVFTSKSCPRLFSFIAVTRDM